MAIELATTNDTIVKIKVIGAGGRGNNETPVIVQHQHSVIAAVHAVGPIEGSVLIQNGQQLRHAVAVVAALTLFFKVEHITVTGAGRYGAEEIIAASGVETGPGRQ